MEILLNCLWLVLSLSLVTVWLAGARRPQGSRAARTSLLPGTRLQVTAIVILLLLLFPVISLTDDLAMCAATRDTEQALRLDDLCQSAHAQPAVMPATLGWLEALTSLAQHAEHRPAGYEAQILALKEGTRLPIDSRPPPVTS